MIRQRVHELSPVQRERFESLADAFDAAWSQAPHSPPEITNHLVDEQPLRTLLLVTLIKTDLECRLKKQENLPVGDYFTRFPELQTDDEARLELVLWEQQLLGDQAADVSTCVLRHPNLPGLATQLEQQVKRCRPQATRVPTQIGEYRILREIDQGGMGVVYEALEEGLNRTVALKLIRPGDIQDRDLLRFRSELIALGQLEHPHIVRIYREGDHAGQPYCAMELLGGGNLSQRLQSQRYLPKDAAALVETLARAIDFAHQRGILHRDLKPANVLFTSDGVPKICDFGLAKHLREQINATQTVELVGTPSYIAPEQATIPPQPATTSIDVYGLGATLYEVLTGRPPFREQSIWKTLEKVRLDPPIPPRKLNPAVPRDLENICLKCLEKNPRQRYATAAELADDLHRFQAGTAVTARQIGLVERVLRGAARRPLHTAVGLLTLALFATLGVVTLVTYYFQESRRTAQELTALTYAHRLALADVRRTEGLFGEMRDHLEACPLDARHWEWRYLSEQCRLRTVLRGHLDMTTCVVVSSDGLLIASASQDGTVKVWKWGDAKPWRDLSHGGWFQRCAAFSPDGRWIASGGDEKVVYVWDMEAGTIHWQLKGHKGAIQEVAFSPDGTVLASCGNDRQVRIWDLTADPSTAPRVCDHPGPVFAMAFSPKGTQLYAAGTFPDVIKWDVQTGTKLSSWPATSASIDSLCVSQSGDRLYSADREFRIKVWDPANGRQILDKSAHQADINSLCLSAGQRWLATVGDDATLQIHAADTLETRLTLQGHRGHMNWVASHPRENVVVTASDDNGVGVWHVGESATHMHRDSSENARDITFNSTGTMWAAAYDDGRVRIHEVEQSDRVITLPRVVGNAMSVSFNGTGDLLAVSGKRRSPDENPGPETRFQLERAVKVFSTADWKEQRDWKWLSPETTALSANDSSRRTNDIAYEMRRNGVVDSLIPLSFTPEGRHVLCGGDDGLLRLWNVDISVLETFDSGHVGPVAHLAFDPAGKILATGGLDHTIILRDWPSRRLIRKISAHADWIYRLAFSPDGSRLASVSADATSMIWQTRTGQLEHKIVGHSNNVLGVTFSPDGKRLVTGGWDGTVRIWDADRGHELLTLKTKSHRVHQVRFSPDSRYLLATQDGGHVEQWDGPRRSRGW